MAASERGHLCPAPGCDVRIPSSLLACRAHWFSIPRELRDELWKEYRRSPFTDGYWAARADCLEALGVPFGEHGDD